MSGCGKIDHVLSVFAFDASGARVVDDPDQISDLIETPHTVVWVDVVESDSDDLARLAGELSLHHLATEDAIKHGQRPKLEIYPSHAFVVAYASADDPSDLPEIDVFVGPNWIVTVREHNQRGAHFDIAAVRERYERAIDSACTVGFLLYTVLDEIVDTYFDAMDRIEDTLAKLEDDIFADPENQEAPIQKEMLELRRDLLLFRRRVVPMRDVVFAILRREIPWIEEAAVVYFQDVLDHLLRIIDQIDTQRELLGNAVDAHLAIVSNNMNEIMKKMTSWGAILLGGTLIAGIYGMNFDDMPELHWVHGFRLALASMLALTVGLYIYFKRKKWL